MGTAEPADCFLVGDLAGRERLEDAESVGLVGNRVDRSGFLALHGSADCDDDLVEPGAGGVVRNAEFVGEPLHVVTAAEEEAYVLKLVWRELADPPQSEFTLDHYTARRTPKPGYDEFRATSWISSEEAVHAEGGAASCRLAAGPAGPSLSGAPRPEATSSSLNDRSSKSIPDSTASMA